MGLGYKPSPLISVPCHLLIDILLSCLPHPVSMSSLVYLLIFSLPPQRSLLVVQYGHPPFSVLITWPNHLNLALLTTFSKLSSPHLLSPSPFGTLSYHLIFIIYLNILVSQLFSRFYSCFFRAQVSAPIQQHWSYTCCVYSCSI